MLSIFYNNSDVWQRLKDIKQAYKVRGNIAKIRKQYELYNYLIDIKDQLIIPGLL